MVGQQTGRIKRNVQIAAFPGEIFQAIESGRMAHKSEKYLVTGALELFLSLKPDVFNSFRFRMKRSHHVIYIGRTSVAEKPEIRLAVIDKKARVERYLVTMAKKITA